MTSHETPLSRLKCSPLRAGLFALIACATILACCAPAMAGTYPMYQCAPGAPAVSPGWSVYGFDTLASTVLTNSCASGGRIGDYVFSNGQAGAVTENGSNGSQVDLAIEVPASAPDVTIQSISANVNVSTVTGDDAFLGFASDGQALPGAVELPYATGSGYSTNDTWTLLQGARAFAAYVNCSTDRSSPTCVFAESTAVPALSDITLTLSDSAPPAIDSTSGTLASAAATNTTVTGAQTLSFTASDPDSGVRAATLTLVPQDGQSPYQHTFDFSTECTYQSWNACPLKQTVNSFTLNTAALADGSYTVDLAVEDAAANTASQQLGTITTSNAPANTSPPSIPLPGQAVVGTTLTAQTGTWSAPSEAGPVTYAYQWEQCDSQGENCEPIAGAQNASYTTTASDARHTLRVIVSAADNDGVASATSAATSIVAAPESTLVTTPGPATTPTTIPAPTTAATVPTAITTPPSTQGSGTPNGTPASETASLHLNGPAAITRPYRQRAFTLTGQLTNNQSQPIADATLDVLQQIAGTNTLTLIGYATTSPSGRFTLNVSAGPSRTIEIAYRALSSDTNYAATAPIQETVDASAQLTITPHHTDPTGTIILSGHAEGPIPPQGTIVELLVYYRGHWNPFRDPRTNSHGTFHVEYQFQGAIGRFPFRAQIPAGQAGHPYTTGYSKIVNVSTR
jgi:hypothetical protein